MTRYTLRFAATFLGSCCVVGLLACGGGDESMVRPLGHGISNTQDGGKKQQDSGAWMTMDSGKNDSKQESCTPGATRGCYAGPANTQHVGGCKDGKQTCNNGTEFAVWGTCTGSVGPVSEVCGNGIDDDCDGKADCEDSDCPPCKQNCKDGNGQPICNDPDCPPCKEDCGNGKDDNGDGLVDCQDSLCASAPACTKDDCTDGNGKPICNDPNCPPCIEKNCADGVDNDSDGWTDCKDKDCPCHEDCSNGKDDNGDGMVDCQDPLCANAGECECGPNGECCDGKDNNGNGVIDEGDVCRNVGEPCPPGSIQACDCYCGVHRKCKPDGTWGACLVDGNYTCMPAVANQNACGMLGMYCDFGLCAASMPLGNECVHHKDCPMPLICDLGFCVPDNYHPCSF